MAAQRPNSANTANRESAVFHPMRLLYDAEDESSDRVDFGLLYFGSGTEGTVYTFCRACWYSPNSA